MKTTTLSILFIAVSTTTALPHVFRRTGNVANCDITAPLSSFEGKLYCGCRPGYKAGQFGDSDSSKQWRIDTIPGHEHRVWVAAGIPCDTVCKPWTTLPCSEVAVSDSYAPGGTGVPSTAVGGNSGTGGSSSIAATGTTAGGGSAVISAPTTSGSTVASSTTGRGGSGSSFAVSSSGGSGSPVGVGSALAISNIIASGNNMGGGNSIGSGRTTLGSGVSSGGVTGGIGSGGTSYGGHLASNVVSSGGTTVRAGSASSSGVSSTH